MEYSWVSSEFKLSQSKGFFVDDNNQIIYWPTKTAPGYIIDHSTALKISNDKRLERVDCIAFFLGLLFIVLSPPMVFDILPLDLPFVFVLGLGIGYHFFFRRIIKQFLFKKIIRLYGPFQEMPKPKPKAKILKPSEVIGKYINSFYIIGMFLAGLFCIYQAVLTDDDQWFQILTATMGVMLFGLSLFLIWLEKTGLNINSQKFYSSS